MQMIEKKAVSRLMAVLAMSIVAALTMVTNPSPASAQGSTVSDTVISIGAITVEQTGPCDMNSTDTHWFCDEFIVSGGDPSVPNVSILSHVNLFTANTHFMILLTLIVLPNGCHINLHGSFLANHDGGTTYHYNGAAGAYLLLSCDFFTTVLIVGVLGGSPSTTTVLAAFEIS